MALICRKHLRQHEGRLTATDVVQEAALAFSGPPAKADHLRFLDNRLV
jgi:hypothetical protein